MAYVSGYSDTGLTVKAIIRNSDLEYADIVAEAMDTYNADDIDDYDITCNEIGTTGEYYAVWPSWLDVGVYTVQFIPIAGETIAESDLENRFAVGTYYWDETDLTLPVDTASDAPTTDEIWSATTRTLSGTAAGTGPTAQVTNTDGVYTVPTNGTLGLYKRIRAWDGGDITNADITSMTYSIYALSDANEDTRTDITGHTAVSMTVADHIYDAVQDDEAASDYNFKFIPSVATNQIFEDTGTTYLVEITITPTSGEVIIERFRVTAV